MRNRNILVEVDSRGNRIVTETHSRPGLYRRSRVERSTWRRELRRSAEEARVMFPGISKMTRLPDGILFEFDEPEEEQG
jgi:hypothetical protein